MKETHIKQELAKLGQRIRTIRENQGYSQEDFAAFAGLERSYYGRIERGEINVSVRNLIRISDALNIELVDLFTSR